MDMPVGPRKYVAVAQPVTAYNSSLPTIAAGPLICIPRVEATAAPTSRNGSRGEMFKLSEQRLHSRQAPLSSNGEAKCSEVDLNLPPQRRTDCSKLLKPAGRKIQSANDVPPSIDTIVLSPMTEDADASMAAASTTWIPSRESAFRQVRQKESASHQGGQSDWAQIASAAPCESNAELDELAALKQQLAMERAARLKAEAKAKRIEELVSQHLDPPIWEVTRGSPRLGLDRDLYGDELMTSGRSECFALGQIPNN